MKAESLRILNKTFVPPRPRNRCGRTVRVVAFAFAVAVFASRLCGRPCFRDEPIHELVTSKYDFEAKRALAIRRLGAAKLVYDSALVSFQLLRFR